jgi:CTP synthase
LLLEQQHVPQLICARLGLNVGAPELTAWRALSANAEALNQIPRTDEVRVAFVGKYVGMHDAYKSLIKALTHASIACQSRLELVFVDSGLLEPGQSDAAGAASAWAEVRRAHAVLVPGGFGVRGVEGKVAAVRYARENCVPFFGICLGLQVAVIEITRTVLGWASNSEEFDNGSRHYNDNDLRISREIFGGDESTASAAPTTRNVVVFMPEVSKTHMGATMRLGERRTIIRDAASISARLYQATDVYERHRHRYEVDPNAVEAIERGTDLRFVGRDETGQRMEIAEIDESKHPFFVSVQFHPEFLSRPLRPAPLFVGFVKAATARMKSQRGETKE